MAVELTRRIATRERRERTIGTGASWPVVGLIAAAVVFLVIGSLTSTIFAQQTVAGIAQGTIFASLALALVLIYRATGHINFAQGEMAMATTYLAYQFTLWGLSYWLAFLLTLVAAFGLGAAVQLSVIRPVEHRSVIAVVIVTVGLFILIDGLVTWKWGADQKFMPAPFGNKVYHLGKVALARQDAGTMIVTFASVLLLWAFFRFTKIGLGMRAGAVRPAAARLVGVRTQALLAVGWGLAAVLGAVAGLMTEPTQYVLQPSMMQAVLLYAFAAAVLGGLESPGGAVVGGLAIGIFLNLVGQYVGFATSELRLPIAFAVLLGVLLLKPSGLFGRREVRRV